MFEARCVVNGIPDRVKGLHVPGVLLRVRLMFCEVLLVESGEIVNVISQVATLVNEGQNVSLEVCPIKEL